MNKNKLISYLAVIVILSGTYFAYQALSGQKKDPPQRPKPEVKNYVKVQVYQPSQIETSVEAFGRVATAKQLNVIAEVGGKLFEGNVRLKKGQAFRKGQLLCKIDDVEENLNLQARKSSFMNILANVLPDLRVDFSNNYQTWQSYFDNIQLDKPIPALPEPKSSKEKTFLATQNILSEYYAIKSEEAHLRKFAIYAPFNGSIVSVNFQTGSVVNAGTNIATIIQTDQLELEVPVELRDIQYVQKGKKVTIVNEKEEWQGTISRIADFVDQNTQSISVFIRINTRTAQGALDGLFLMAKIPGKTIDNAVRVPRSILKNKNEVFVVENGMLKTKAINVHKLGDDTAVISGLTEGDQYVTDRPSNASENMKVEIIKG